MMNRTRLLVLALVPIAFAACQDAIEPTAPAAPDEGPAPQLTVQQAPERVAAGRVLVRLAEGADPAAVGRAHGVAFDRTVARGRVAVFRVAAGNERAVAARMGRDLEVVYAEPDYLRQPTGTDPLVWSMYNPGGLTIDYTRGRKSGTPVTSMISVADADIFDGSGWVDASGGSQVHIASIDTGVELDHPEFGGPDGATVVAGYDYYSDDGDPSDTDDHGTHTTGTMVGKTVGVASAAGAASNVTVHVYRVCGGGGCPTSAIVSAIYDATDDGVVAMNLSLGGASLAQSEADAIAYATAHGSLVIAAAGNDGTGTVSCPACDPNAISVAATDWMDEQAYYTNWGPGLDIAAPGGELYSNTTPESGIYSSIRGGQYAYFQGTSMATPHVTGAAAVLASANGLTVPDATRSETLRALLLCNTDDVGASGYDERFGNGRLDLAKALGSGASASCSYGSGGSGGGGGGGSGGGGGGDTGDFAFGITAGKLRGGINAVRIDSWTGYSGSTVDMNIQEIDRWERDVPAGYIYSTGQKGGATYTVEVCTRESTARCGTRQVIF